MRKADQSLSAQPDGLVAVVVIAGAVVVAVVMIGALVVVAVLVIKVVAIVGTIEENELE